ncbi:MAG TPA: DUF4440 domain-containing protein [Candidatus Angelobacter sp.]|jgi:ketosteroid isomerase-like protein|nr:DUF4440 domain-containing protein [Candidatus Angelobacter sp.]
MKLFSKTLRLETFRVWLGLSLLLLAVGCSSAPAPAPDTRAADEAAVRKADADWVKAAQTKKVEDWVAFYSEDAVILPPNEKTVSSKADISKFVGNLLMLPGLSLSWQPTKVEVAKSGDLAYLYGTYQLTATGPDGKSMSDSGKLVEIWKKQADGNWKCAVDTWSSDLPPVATPPPSK